MGRSLLLVPIYKIQTALQIHDVKQTKTNRGNASKSTSEYIIQGINEDAMTTTSERINT